MLLLLCCKWIGAKEVLYLVIRLLKKVQMLYPFEVLNFGLRNAHQNVIYFSALCKFGILSLEKVPRHRKYQLYSALRVWSLTAFNFDI